ncbi:hypothetical protein [Lactococcus lactis]|uniref:Uncharacterized protein n=1 Tax=Lactococcus lactis TaxID=1358 RepID=A0AAW8U949_9LACT|nr:hypothetical protein [Lactococcus lactis]MDT2880326.1 hypothetical protein [Lactococcus lactis]MDT2945374.1 hypothetical protein [Lactococcus lactis]MDT2947540.1 hypothetical protein [Lactococcus lactis]
MSQQLSLFDIEKENGLQISPEEKRQLKELYSQGYRFVTDNSEIESFPLSFWSYLPVRIKVTERDGIVIGNPLRFIFLAIKNKNSL